VKQAVERNVEGDRRFCGQRRYERVDRRTRHSNNGAAAKSDSWSFEVVVMACMLKRVFYTFPE